MKNEFVIKRFSLEENAQWGEIEAALKTLPYTTIGNVNWKNYPYCPEVFFKIGVSDTAFLLRFRVDEKSVRAMAQKDNGEVWKDSCVEFFFSPNTSDGIYYNFEFNCAGVCLLGAGPERNNREHAPQHIIDKIRRRSTFEGQSFPETLHDDDWTLTAEIPFECLWHHEGFKPHGLTCRANFYKCGDELSVPHFLSWSPIATETPNFHCPEYFAEVKFEQ